MAAEPDGRRRRRSRRHLERGVDGERLARRYLQRKGLRILEVGYRAARGEIDLIARTPDGITVFVEVRTRAAGALCSPLDSIDARKRARWVRAAQAWLVGRGDVGAVRFDAIAIDWDDGGRHRVQHVIDAFRPDSRAVW